MVDVRKHLKPRLVGLAMVSLFGLAACGGAATPTPTNLPKPQVMTNTPAALDTTEPGGPSEATSTPLTPEPLCCDPGDWLVPEDQIPSGMVIDVDRVFPNDEVAQVNYDDPQEGLDYFAEVGRVTSYLRGYANEGACEAEEVTYRYVSEQTVLFASPEGANTFFFDLYDREVENGNEVIPTDSVGEVGLYYFFDSSSPCGGEEILRVVVIYFQRLNVWAQVKVWAIQGALTDDELNVLATQLAQTIDENLLAAGE